MEKSVHRPTLSFFLGKYLDVECLGSMVGICMTSKETSKLLSKVAVSLSIPTSRVLLVRFVDIVYVLRFHAGVGLSLCPLGKLFPSGDVLLNLGDFLELYLWFPLHCFLCNVFLELLILGLNLYFLSLLFYISNF